MIYKIGQTVIHKSHGSGEIVNIEEREFSDGKTTKFYVLAIKDNGAIKKVFVPFESAKERLRKVIEKNEIDKVYSLLSNKSLEIDFNTWNRRYRTYMESISTGDIFEIAKVFSSLMTLSKLQELNFGERKLLDQCKTSIVREINAITGETESLVETKIENMCKNA